MQIKQLNVTAEQIDDVVGAETVDIEDIIGDIITIPSSNNANSLLKEMQILGSPVKAIPIGITNPGAGNYTMVDGTIYIAKVYISETMTITGLMFGGLNSGEYTADNFNGVALFSVSGGTLTRVAISANNGNLWKVSYWGSNITFTSTYVAQPGLYAIAVLYNSSSETSAQQLVTGTSWVNNMAIYSFDTDYSVFGVVANQTTIPTTIEESNITPVATPVLLMLY